MPETPKKSNSPVKSKSLFKSKTFWLNVIGMASTFVPAASGLIAPEHLVYVLGGLNVANRVLTSGPVHVLADAASEP